MAWAIGFFILAIVSAAVGASPNNRIPLDFARIFTIIFLILAIIALIL